MCKNREQRKDWWIELKCAQWDIFLIRGWPKKIALKPPQKRRVHTWCLVPVKKNTLLHNMNFNTQPRVQSVRHLFCHYATIFLQQALEASLLSNIDLPDLAPDEMEILSCQLLHSNCFYFIQAVHCSAWRRRAWSSSLFWGTCRVLAWFYPTIIFRIILCPYIVQLSSTHV